MNRLLMQLLGGLYREGEQGAEGGGSGAGAGAGAGSGDDKSGASAGNAGDKGGSPGTGTQGAEGSQGAGDASRAAGLVEEARRLAEGQAPATVIADKFIVKAADGKAIDYEATAKKVAQSNAELERRLGQAGGLAPAKADEYKLELQEGEKDLPVLDEKLSKDFKDRAMKAGLSQKQYNEMVRSGNAIIAEVVKGLNLPDPAVARQALVKHYGGEAQYKEAAARAFQGFAAFADDADMAELDTIGDYPVFIRIFDRIAAELGEEKLPRFNVNATAAEDAQVQQLQGDVKSAYWNAKDPGHAAAVAKVTAWHERKTASQNSRFAK